MFFFIHGWAATAEVWSGLFMPEEAYCYQSSLYPDYQHLEKTFHDVWHKQGKKLIVVGWSLGGMLSLQLAADHPDKVERLILISSTARFTTCEHYAAGLPSSIVKNLARKLAYEKWETQLGFYKLMFSPTENVCSDLFIRYTAPLFSAIELAALQNGLHFLMKADLRLLLPSIAVNCLVIHGTGDTICPPSAAQYVVENLPNAALALIPDAGHIPFLTQPEMIKRLIDTYIKENTL